MKRHFGGPAGGKGGEENAMLRRLRWKNVGICMSLVTFLLAAVLYAVFLSARQNLERLSIEVLHRVIQETPGQYGTDIGGREVALPYFTVNLWGDTAYVTGGTYSDLEDTETLAAILTECLNREEPEGTLPAYGLRYLRHDNGWHIRVAFVDTSMERAAVRKLLGSYLLIAAAALVPLLGISILLSRWAAAPVEKAWRQQQRFLSDASHELKTPLTVILSNADLLAASGLDGPSLRWADNIRSESRRMKTLVEEMLTLARADHAIRAVVHSGVSFTDVTTDCALAFEPVAFEAGKPLRYEIAPGVMVTGDGEKLRQLVSILLDNAVKYGAEGGTITLSLEKTDRQARLTVSNPGEPIPAETLPRLFERFYRSDASRGRQSGFGLGLSIAEAVAREHRGSLRAESGEGGTRFVYAMPLLRPAARRERSNPGTE